MCGFAGILHSDQTPVDRARLDRMLERLRHRGPDGSGIAIDGPCGFAHARLAVTDPAGGAQPMSDGHGLTVVFNGEIYNHRALRRALESLGHRFISDHSDTEVLLHGYRQWGTGLCHQLEGMFAFALWDSDQRTLLLARDRVGKKPLFVHQADQAWHFASAVNGLDITPEIDRRALTHYLAFGYTDEQSLLAGVSEIPAGHFGVVDARGQLQLSAYWQAPEVDIQRAFASVEAVEAALSASVADRLEADVPLGCFLSGGIDSGLIAALAQRALHAQGRRLKTFCMAMPEVRYDESAWAQQTARHLGTEHVTLQVEPDLEADLVTLVKTAGEPLGDSSILPTYWISGAARRHVTVALSGDGGDELFVGYDRYRAMRWLARWRRWIRMLPVTNDCDAKGWMSRVSRLKHAAMFSDSSQAYQSMVSLFDAEGLEALEMKPLAGMPQWPEADDPMDAARRWDFKRYLPFDLLRKVDRASMAVALEVRCPMLDRRVVEPALSAPAIMLGGGKPMLRGLARRCLPRAVVEKPKTGFAVPIGSWFARRDQSLLKRRLLDSPLLFEQGLNRHRLECMIAQQASGERDHAQRLFALLSLSIWLDEFYGAISQ